MQTYRFGTLGVLGGGLLFTITGMANPFFTLYAQELGVSTIAIGMLVTLRALLPIFIAIPSGQLIDTVGPIRMLKIGNACLISSLVVTVLADGMALLAISQILLGGSIVMMASSFQVLVARGGRARRNRAIKQYAMWMSAGGMLGPIVGGVIASGFEAPLDGYRTAFLASSLAATAFMLALFWGTRAYLHRRAGSGEATPAGVRRFSRITASYRQTLHLTRQRPVRFGLTATFIIMYIQALYMSFLPLFMSEFGYSTLEISLLISLKGFSAMLARYALTRLMQRFALEHILTTAGTIAAVCVVLTPLAGMHLATMVLLIMVMGAAVGINLPVSIMIMVDAIGDGERGKLMGLRLLVNRFSQVLSPALFGLLGHLFGLSAAFFGSGVVLVAGMIGFSTYAWKLSTWADKGDAR